MEANKNLNHSAAHLLACAIKQLYPDTKLAIGPAIAEGFYYDFEFTNPLSENDLPKIEKRMQKIAKNNYLIKQIMPQSLQDQPYKLLMLDELIAQKVPVTYYGFVDKHSKAIIFSDLCKGGHVNSTSALKHFKLLSISGAYWRGDSKNKPLTRIYGTAWETNDELLQYLEIIKQRKERDHRKIGKELKIFTFDQMTGQGFPILLANGLKIKTQIQTYLREQEHAFGFTEVQTPIFGEKTLYEISGHLKHYQEDMFPILEMPNEHLVLRPMSCPHHIIIYKQNLHSYRDLPLRLSEHAFLYRYEKSGALNGLERVRAMELTDAHIFCRHDQIVDEFKNAYNLINKVLNKFKIEIDYISLSLHDPMMKNKYYDDEKMWFDAEKSLKQVLKDLKLEYQEKIGEAAFYGPKIDIQVKNALGHEITLSTLQLDFLLPQKFNLKYTNHFGEKVMPVMIHRGLIGTYERFIAILLEQYKGDLPFWIAPRQIVIIPINEKHLRYAQSIYKKLQTKNYRVNLDLRHESLSKKIREAQISKTKFQIVIGDDEVAHKNLDIREYGSKKQKKMSLSQFLKLII